jgi:predicted ATPase
MLYKRRPVGDGTRVGDVSMTLLGGFAANVGGVPVPESAWRLKKARELVKLLALAPRHRLHREEVMDLLWRDREPAAAANNLHQAVYVARRALDAGSIEVRDEALLLVADVDVDGFALAAAAARRARTSGAYRAALALYGGELLPENCYDDWTTERRDELAELAAELTEELAALGPDSPGRLRPLPAEASSFIGRERELAELKVLLGSTRLLTLAGTGGAGKTRLALELSRDVAGSYYDGAAFVELADLADAALVPGAFAAALDARGLSGHDPVDAMLGFLGPRSFLLFVDNCEHLLAAAAALAATLLRSAPRLTILATSREPLRVPGEVVFRVPSLDIPDPTRATEVNELVRYEAVRLFVDRAAAVAPGFALDSDNAPDVARICLRLDGLPLALELAAGRLAALGPAAIAERLDDRFRVLRTGSHVSPNRQHTLTATLQWSHDLLEPDERTLFRRLAVFAGGFDLEAVESVCSGDRLDGPGIADVFARLVEKSLVAVEESVARARRYRLLETVRLYARERLDEADESSMLAERHARWALLLAEQERGSPRLDREAANLRVALGATLKSAPDDALRFCVALWPFWMRRIDLDEAQRRFDSALAATTQRTALRARALLRAAALTGSPELIISPINIAEVRTNATDGRPGLRIVFEDTAQPFLEISCDAALGYVLANRAALVSGRGDLAQARELLWQSAWRFEESGDERGKAAVLVRRAYLELAEGDVVAARLALEAALELRREHGDRRGVGLVLAGLGLIDTTAGEYASAARHLAEAREMFRRAGDRWGLAGTLWRTADLAFARGRLDDAEAALREARTMLVRTDGNAGSRPRSRGWPRWHCSGAIASGHVRCSPMRAIATRRAMTRSASRKSRPGCTRFAKGPQSQRKEPVPNLPLHPLPEDRHDRPGRTIGRLAPRTCSFLRTATGASSGCCRIHELGASEIHIRAS